MMAEVMDSVTGVGSKRRITEIAETLLLEQPELSNSVSPVTAQDDSSVKASSLVASSPKGVQEITQGLPSPNSSKNPQMLGSIGGEKVDLFVNEENMEDSGGKIGDFGEQLQENEASVIDFVSGSDLKKVDIEGTVSLTDVKVKKGKGIVSARNEEFDGGRIEEKKEFLKEAENLLEAKKKQLLAKFDAAAGILGNLKGIDESVRPSLKVEVIDDTVLIDTVPFLKNGNGCVKNAQRNGKKNEKQEADGKKAKRPRRKGKDGRKYLGTSDVLKKMPFVGNAFDGMNRIGENNKRKYTREEMEALRFVNIVEQRNLWKAVYAGLGDVVMKEYKDLAGSMNQKNFQLKCDPSQRFGKNANAPGILSKAGSGNGGEELETGEENMKLSESSSCLGTGDEDGNSCVEEDCNDEYDSDEEYASIHRPAFHVEGEPNFDSGPPEDGLEYLRRVRWEATHVPKVTVAKRDSKLDKEQSVYMPQFPEMEKCAEYLLPLKQWEDTFLADFSELRKLLAYEDCSVKISSKMESFSIVQEQKNTSSVQLAESTILEKFNKLGSDGVRSDELFDGSEDSNTLSDVENTRPSSVDDCSSSKYPRLSAILAMEPVARVSMLRKRISLSETASTLTKDDCVWLFALCAAVDIPVDADTCAALRSLLRKCTRLRAAKTQVDDEVIMLNILVTISAKFFGQSTWTELV